MNEGDRIARLRQLLTELDAAWAELNHAKMRVAAIKREIEKLEDEAQLSLPHLDT